MTAIRFNPVAPVSCRYGAPMGRNDRGADFDWTRPLHLVRLPWGSDGAYDRGGSYWGCGDPIYCAHDAAGDFVRYVRARSRDDAKRQICTDHDLAWFHGERAPLRIYDNGYRYTAVYRNEPEGNGLVAARAMDGDPYSPGGFGQMTTATDGPHLGKRIAYDDLPDPCQRLIYNDLCGSTPC
jgi:hypothetical protein